MLKATVALLDEESMPVIIIGEDALEELRRELAKPESGPPDRIERKRPGKKKDPGKGTHVLPCADMTCPCRITGER